MLFLGIQTALPLRYYLGSDPYDERFAWRMYSPVFLAGCQVNFSTKHGLQGDGTHTVDPEELVHSAAVTLMRLGRSEAVERFAELWCPRHPGAPLYAQHTCMQPETLDRMICHTLKVDRAELLDAYERDWNCRDTAPEVCLERDCDSLNIKRCIRRRCLVQLRPVGQDLCAAR